MDNKILGMVSLSILVESVITYSKDFFIGGDFSFSMLFSIILGIVIAIAYNLDLPEYLNLKSSVPYIGSVLTGILISRGSNYLYDILKSITNIK